MDICDYSPVLIGIKTKLDNANWFPIRNADTPDQKRFLNPAGSHLAGFVFSASGEGREAAIRTSPLVQAFRRSGQSWFCPNRLMLAIHLRAFGVRVVRVVRGFPGFP